MEKLQAALARAREKREDGDGGRATRPELSARNRSRRMAQAEAVDDAWNAVQRFEPSEKRLHDSRIFATEASHEAQYFDILRTKLLLEMRRNNWTRIGITSATPSCGKTTIACNLIAGLVRQPEFRGILFDMDFRRPAVSKMFGASPTASLEDVLSETVGFEEQAMRLGDNTIVSMTTNALSDPAKLMNRVRTAEILDEIQAVFRPDMMLFDLPPVLVSDETRAFLKLIDATIVVAGAESSTVSQIDEVEREVAQYTNVAGIVLNKCRFIEDGYGYSY
ncbi:MAG: exopolysaccharide biosynthesis protein [Silicimonas sp.]|nr:exopolysaccharide biosynthesis protein [Silicimonas sp.]NNF92184.1 exopolysaccharide biosynthesis protein [Boseongicola sp.]RZW11449.1 MAG: tyrosine-protein kinase family protein [Paracoccaceae bacterium]NND21054.1 exopolysaccharide biosynthesis protein [Silicimonas sp.]NND40891.1 exopolysaccharide biosynthesis protein [Silicimonas sp.]